MRAALLVAFALLMAVLVGADLRATPYGQIDSMTTQTPVDEVALLTLVFFLETLGTASGDHLVRGAEFDIPTAEYQQVAVIYGNLYIHLCIVRKLTDILMDTCKMTALFYTEATSELKATTYRVHYEMLKSQLKTTPKISFMYDVERENVRQQKLPELKNGGIDIEQMKIIRMSNVLQKVLQNNDKFRKLMICLRFAEYSTMAKDNTYALTEAPERCVMSQAVIRMSQRTDIGKRVQQVYEEALEKICSQTSEEPDVDKIDQQLFTILEKTFQKYKDLNDQLEQTKMEISKS